MRRGSHTSGRAIVLALGIAALLACKTKGTPPAPVEVAPAIELVRAGAPVTMPEEARKALRARVEKALAICNFKSDSNAHLFEGVKLDELWKKREAASHLRLKYPKPIIVVSTAGALELDEVLLSIDEPFGPEPALVKLGDRILGLKKCGYDDRMLGCDPALAAQFKAPAACPPGL